jgi:hypothetical protein
MIKEADRKVGQLYLPQLGLITYKCLKVAVNGKPNIGEFEIISTHVSDPLLRSAWRNFFYIVTSPIARKIIKALLR